MRTPLPSFLPSFFNFPLTSLVCLPTKLGHPGCLHSEKCNLGKMKSCPHFFMQNRRNFELAIKLKLRLIPLKEPEKELVGECNQEEGSRRTITTRRMLCEDVSYVCC
jgi:hypothetical protein